MKAFNNLIEVFVALFLMFARHVAVGLADA